MSRPRPALSVAALLLAALPACGTRKRASDQDLPAPPAVDVRSSDTGSPSNTTAVVTPPPATPAAPPAPPASPEPTR